MEGEIKVNRAKETRLANKARRKSMDKRVYSLKVDVSHISEKKLKLLSDIFIQAKWLVNSMLSESSIFTRERKDRNVTVLTFNPETQKCDLPQARKLTIGSQLIQSIVDQKKMDVLNLAKAKSKGVKVGTFKFKKDISTVNLNQHGTTYTIFGEKYVKLQGVGKLKVSGIEQVAGKEIASAKLVKKASGFYFKVLTYSLKEKVERYGSIGIDFGIKDSVVDSNGEKFNWNFPIPPKLKRKQKQLSRKVKSSNNYRKQCERIKRNYEQLTNQKDDAANKYVASLKKYEKVVIQDENIKGWHANLFGKQVQQSILGRIKSKIQNLETSVVIDRWLPTTKLSPVSFKKIDINLNDRIFKDGNFEEDRDIKSAKTILCLGLYGPKLTHKVLMGLPAEALTSVFSNYMFVENKLKPLKQEAATL